ncbi:hypothetical protein QTP88_029148 [Uroleucon formosanum]
MKSPICGGRPSPPAGAICGRVADQTPATAMRSSRRITGQGRLVTKRLGRRHPVIEEPTLSNIVRELFPALPTINWDLVPLERSVPAEIIEHPETSTPLFTADELWQAVRKLPSGKAPGPDNIPNEIINLAAERSPEMFLETFNACLTNSQLPNRWKRAKLILLHKGAGKPPDQPSSYRPISLLDGGGKLLERLLLNCLESHKERSGALSGLQFGFRRHRSTTDTIEEVIKAAREAGRGGVQNRHLCAVVTLDVKNAFNTAPWTLIDESLQRSSVPEYLIRILRSYMSERKVLIGGEGSTDGQNMKLSCGVRQGSVLGPTLWNLFYDGILRLPVQREAKLVAFADDIAIVATAHNAELLEQLVNPILSDIVKWTSDNGLRLAPEKSECVLLTKKHGHGSPKLNIDGFQVSIKRAIRYLGVQLDTRMTFVEHSVACIHYLLMF